MRKVRFALFGLLVAAGFALAPAAFARSHWNVGIGIGLPGVNIGYSDCRHCGRGYYGGGYASFYSPTYYAPAYYAPAYSYYEPADYGYPAYGAVYYDRPVYRHRYHVGRYEGRGHHRDYGRGYDRDGGHRARYYDRDNGYHH
jgi:hypothetical protein